MVPNHSYEMHMAEEKNTLSILFYLKKKSKKKHWSKWQKKNADAGVRTHGRFIRKPSL